MQGPQIYKKMNKMKTRILVEVKVFLKVYISLTYSKGEVRIVNKLIINWEVEKILK